MYKLTIYFVFGVSLLFTSFVFGCFKGDDGGYERICGYQVAVSSNGLWEIHTDDEEDFFTGYGFRNSKVEKFVKIDGWCQQGVIEVTNTKVIIHTYCPYKKKPGLYNVVIGEDGGFEMVPILENAYSRKFPKRKFKKLNL